MSIEDIRARLEAATPGPWAYDGHGWVENLSDDMSQIVARVEQAETGAFISNAPTDMARLLAALDAVTALADAWTARGEHLMKYAESAPSDVSESLDDQGMDMVHNAKLITAAINNALKDTP